MAILAAVGCGGSNPSVKGRVTFQGQPLDKGSISFESADGQDPSTGGMIEAGRYELTGEAAPTPGKKIVRIRGSRKTGKQIKAGPPFPPEHMIDEEEQIPADYNEQSSLSAEIVAGKDNESNFDLKAKGR